MKSYPSLKICGNPQASAGYTNIYIINEPTFEIPNLSHEGMGALPYYFVVTVTPYNVQYILVHNKAKSFGASRAGILKIGISIPKYYRLSGGKSPYDVLMEIYQAMLANNMTLVQGTTDDYQYKEQMCPAAVFEQILERYPFEKYVSAYRPMTGQGAALLVTDRAREFMIDPHYPQLCAYKEIIVAQGGAYPTTVQLPAIPRQPNYRLVVNNQPTAWPVANPWDTPVDIKVSGYDEMCYEMPRISFKLSEIVNDPTKAPDGVRVSTDEEAVYCTVTPKPRTRTLRFDIEGVDNENLALSKIVVTIAGARRTLTPQGLLILSGKEINAKMAIDYNGSDYYIKDTKIDTDNRVRIFMEPVTRATITTTGHTTANRINQNTQPIAGTDDNKPQQFVVVVDAKAVSDSNRSARVKLSPNKGQRKLCLIEEMDFDPVFDSNSELKAWVSTPIDLPAAIASADNCYYISVATGNGRYKDERVAMSDIKNPKRGSRVPTLKGFDLEGREFHTVSFAARYHKPMVIAFFVLLFALGVLCGILGSKWIPNNGDVKQGTEQTDTINGGDDNQGTGEEQQEATAQVDPLTLEDVNKLYERLDSIDIRFDDIKKLYYRIGSINDFDPDKKRKVEAYFTIVDAIENLSNRYNSENSSELSKEFEDSIIDKNNNWKYITNDQLKFCRYLYKQSYYNDNDALKDKVYSILSKSSRINHFQDLKEIYEQAKNGLETQGSSSTGGESEGGKTLGSHVKPSN